jgi:ribulose-phosphate 3-epimerase
VKALRPHLPDTVFDVKLGVIEPEHRISDFVKAGADILSIHPESTLQPAAVIHMIESSGCIPGLVLNPGTSVESVVHLLDQVKIVVVMLVSPGWGGPKYIPAALEKIKKLSEISKERGLDLLIEVDGGVSSKNVQQFLDAGANTIVAGGSIFSSDDKKGAIDSLRGNMICKNNYVMKSN